MIHVCSLARLHAICTLDGLGADFLLVEAAAQNKRAEARSAYKAAAEKATDAAFRETLRLKLDALGE